MIIRTVLSALAALIILGSGPDLPAQSLPLPPVAGSAPAKTPPPPAAEDDPATIQRLLQAARTMRGLPPRHRLRQRLKRRWILTTCGRN